jgi:hypothetical protein
MRAAKGTGSWRNAAIVAGALLVVASAAGTPAQAQLSNHPGIGFNRPLTRPLLPSGSTPLSPSEQMRVQDFSNQLSNRERQSESLGGTAGANAMLQTERQMNRLQLEQPH